MNKEQPTNIDSFISTLATAALEAEIQKELSEDEEEKDSE